MDQSNLPLVSIIAVCYNHARFLEETLDSIKGQTYPNIQLIIMDDCSQDNSVEVIHNWIERNQVKCTFIAHQVNQGLCKTLNEAIILCEGKYVQMISCDDILMPQKLSVQVPLLEQSNEKVAVIFSDSYLMKDDGSEYYGWFIQRHKDFAKIPEGDLYDELLSGNFIPAMTALVKRSVYSDVGLYDEKLSYEDYDMWLRIAKKYKFIFSNYVSARYRFHEGNLHKRSALLREANFFILSKHLPQKTAIQKIKKMVTQSYLNGGKSSEIVQHVRKNNIDLFHGDLLKFFIFWGLPPLLYRIFRKIVK